MKNKRNLVIFIISYLIISLLCSCNTFAISQSTTTDISSIDSNLYPQVKDMIQNLQNAHPNWKFKVLYTDIEWSTAIANEYVGHGSSPRNLVPTSGYTNEWICSVCGANKKYDNGNWYCASEKTIKYLMDARNAINDTNIFQFMELTYTGCNIDTIKTMVKNTFLDNESYIQAIVNAAQKYNVNAYYIVARIIQEQGRNGSTLCAGNGYKGQYVGVYNVFNIGANGNGKETVILNGLRKAQSYGWTTMEASIDGGISIISSSYIAKGQNTLYFQKFDVENSDGNLYWHQYMQNVFAAQSEGNTLRKTFESVGSINGEYTFIIPLFKNMPTNASAKPNTVGQDVQTPSVGTDLVKVNVVGSLRVRNAPNGDTTVARLYDGEIVTRLEKATTKINGTYWDYIMKSDGTKGYAARETYDYESSYKMYLVPVVEEKPAETTQPSTPTPPQAPTEEPKVENKKGDLDGDGKIDSMDMYNVIQYMLGNIELSEQSKTSADINQDGKIDSMDMYLMIQQIINE